MKIWIDGKVKTLEKSNLDLGYFYGFGCFETLYVKDFEPFLLEAHLERLHKSLAQLGIGRRVSEQEVRSAIATLGAKHCGLKINVSPNHLVFSLREIRYKKEDYERGFSLQVSSMLVNPTSPTIHMKTMNYMDHLLIHATAKEAGYDEALLLNPQGHVCETTMANLLIEENGTLYTPPVEDGLLPGIMRAYFMEKLDVVERSFTLEELYEAQGLYLSNSLVGAIKVCAIEERPVKEGTMSGLLAKTFLEGMD